MTVAAEIYATGTHPYDGSQGDVARTPEEMGEVEVMIESVV